MEKSTIVLTDSGGIQEEAPGLGKPVLVMRDTTERPEALEAGTVKLVGTNYDKIVNEVSACWMMSTLCEEMSKAVNLWGWEGLCPYCKYVYTEMIYVVAFILILYSWILLI